MPIDLNSGSDCAYTKPLIPPPPTIADIVNAHIDRGIKAARGIEAPRDYLGASRIGEACARKLAYEYLKMPGEEFTGRQLRIFEAGHVFEDMVARWLRDGGFNLRTEKASGGQYGFETMGGRIRGHIDGVLLDGPDLGQPYPGGWETKAINDRSWNDTVKKGVKVSKPIYYAQMQTYCAYLDLAWFLFTAFNKNTQEIYHEMVLFNAADAQALSDRAVDIIRMAEAGELPARIASTPDYFECRFCGHKERCWGSQ